MLATESLAGSTSLAGGGGDLDVLYSVEEAGAIVDATTKILKNAVVDNGGGVDAVANLFLLYCPELNAALSKAAGIVATNRDLAKMALVFSEVHDEIQVQGHFMVNIHFLNFYSFLRTQKKKKIGHNFFWFKITY